MSLGVKFPFTIQSGSVALTDDPAEAIGSQVTFCLGTMIGERVMRPTWGVDTQATGAFELGAKLTDTMKVGIEQAFKVWFPNYEPRDIIITRNSQTPTYIEIEVRFGRYNSAVDSIARVGTQLPGGIEIYPNEGL